MKILILFGILLAPFVHAETLSFSGTVLEDQKNSLDLFGPDVEVGDSATIDISIDLSTPVDGIDITPQLPGATGAVSVYPLTGRGVMNVEIGSAALSCELTQIFIADDLIYPPNFPSPSDFWAIGASSGANCEDRSVSVGLVGVDNSVLSNTDFFLPTDLTGYDANFSVSKLVPLNEANIMAVEAANGSIDTVGPSPEELLEDLAQVVLTANLQAGISNALDSKLASALAALDDSNENNDAAALNSMYAFCNSVEAQRDKRLSDMQADTLIEAANAVIVALDEFAPLCE